MRFNLPKNDAKYRWTAHVVRKMQHYALSADRVKRVMRAPARMEESVVPGAVGVMQKAGTPKKPSEIWVMYRQDATKGRKVVITAWRYPGVSPVRDTIPIPADILAEVRHELALLSKE
ncbi:MAG: hypothetical protein QY311_03235 [Candidatus Paceibacterota bacterium]|nr:MAG: hypothetical protein QY311_03235 [Candidatus Paceibacterota bacterium]